MSRNSSSASESAREAGSASRISGGTGSRHITFWGLLDAFRRCWVPALAIAVPTAILTSAAVWEFLPPSYESTALLQIHQYEQVLFQPVDDRSAEFLTYRDSQINYMKSRPVLLDALQREGVRDCPTLKDIAFPIDWLDQNLEIKEDLSPEFVRISLQGQFPEDLAKIVNAVKDAYLDKVVYNERNDRIQSLRGLEESFKELDDSVRENQERIDQLARDLGTGDAKVAGVIQAQVQQQLRDLQGELREINAEVRAEMAAREYLQERGLSASSLGTSFSPGTLGGTRPLTPGDPLALSADPRQQLQLIQRQIRQFESQLRDHNHPDLVALRREEAELKAILTAGTNAAGEAAGVPLSRLDLLQRQRTKVEKEMKELTQELHSIGSRVVTLEREKTSILNLQTTRDDLAKEIERRAIELDRPLRVKVIQTANVPEQQNQKKRMQLSALGLLASFCMIVAGFTLFEWFSYRIGAASDVTGKVGIRLIGTIPSPDRGGLLGLGVFAGRVNPDEWQRAVIESMDVVRTYLLRHLDPSRPASLLITSASANEGKTTVSCQLAASLARIGRRVALVDCDFRRPSAHELVDGRPGPGLSELLRGEASLESICQPTQAAGLTFIPAGSVDQAALQALSGDGGRSIIDRLKAEFDFVVIDTSPLLFVAEPSMLAQNADVVLLSTRKDYSRVPYVLQSRDSLRSLNVPLLGAVMVGADSDFQRQTYGYRQEVVRQAAPARPSATVGV